MWQLKKYVVDTRKKTGVWYPLTILSGLNEEEAVRLQSELCEPGVGTKTTTTELLSNEETNMIWASVILNSNMPHGLIMQCFAAMEMTSFFKGC